MNQGELKSRRYQYRRTYEETLRTWLQFLLLLLLQTIRGRQRSCVLAHDKAIRERYHCWPEPPTACSVPFPCIPPASFPSTPFFSCHSSSFPSPCRCLNTLFRPFLISTRSLILSVLSKEEINLPGWGYSRTPQPVHNRPLLLSTSTAFIILPLFSSSGHSWLQISFHYCYYCSDR